MYSFNFSHGPNLKNIEHINLSSNKIEELPERFHKLMYLQILDVSHNNLKTVSKKLKSLSQLHFLNLTGNISLKENAVQAGTYLNSYENHVKVLELLKKIQETETLIH